MRPRPPAAPVRGWGRRTSGSRGRAAQADNNGNLTDDGTPLYGYGLENRLVGVKLKSTSAVVATYVAPDEAPSRVCGRDERRVQVLRQRGPDGVPVARGRVDGLPALVRADREILGDHRLDGGGRVHASFRIASHEHVVQCVQCGVAVQAIGRLSPRGDRLGVGAHRPDREVARGSPHKEGNRLGRVILRGTGLYPAPSMDAAEEGPPQNVRDPEHDQVSVRTVRAGAIDAAPGPRAVAPDPYTRAVASTRDRIHRILSDGASATPAPAPETPRRTGVRARLKALGLDRPNAQPLAPPPADPPWIRAALGDERPLEEQVGGHLRETPLGSFVEVERRYPSDARHGCVRLGDAYGASVPLRGGERGPDALPRLGASEAVFLDTETTGLAGGTGTVAFLIGTGRLVGETFVVRQYCMRDFPEEAAVLHALRDDIGDAPLVTFNGRSFDWPLLLTRFRLHRMDAPARAHLDLLPPARRLWSHSLASHTLSRLEQDVLGLQREQDLPGWRIPRAYFDYMVDGRAGLVAGAFKHNEIDVVSMLALMGRIADILDDPTGREGTNAQDQLGTARFLVDLGQTAKAKHCLEQEVQRAPNGEALPLLRALGHLCRRQGAYDESLDHWVRLARTAPAFDAEAFEQAAKLNEHRRRDYAEALRWTAEALARVPKGTRMEEAFLHREARLRRRMRHAAREGS